MLNQSIKKTLVSIGATVVIFFLSPLSSAATDVRCRIQSSDFLSDGEVDRYTESYSLSAPATRVGGRHLLQQTDQYELWLKTHAYVRQEDTFNVTGYSVVLLDKHSRLMSEASSTQVPPKRAELTVHSLNENMRISGRLILDCEALSIE
ncbi:hypothetical protein [Agaribacterium sp. ZY112]|uniref:hypothetical protein n=1 Tax=Agaribacterium sp. ZY112 TaxID=3233574 RepID=UPI0035236357